ncbi:MAG: ABC transporter ATP-binding protein [Anaerolineae bacterium]|nr:ABC transporter ATP-binding protein [Anaerolineae bacterium]
MTGLQTLLHTSGLMIGYARSRQQQRVIASGLEVQLAAGELVCLLGPNGAGKSTLLRTLSGLQQPLQGSVYLRGKPIHSLKSAELARLVSVVLTYRVEVGMLSVYGLVALGRHPYSGWMGRLSAADDWVIRESLAAVGMSEFATRFVNELSDGERQKVMIARALAQQPQVMILDEPTAFLDVPRRMEIMHLLGKLARESGCSILLSTHDLDLAMRTADRVWLLSAEGQLQSGAPEDLVLNGGFESVFRSEGVQFDEHSGMFKVNGAHSGYVTLQGEGVPAIWTRRALERAGFTVTSDALGNHPLVEVEPIGRETRWRFRFQGYIEDYQSVYDLVAAAQRHRAVSIPV